jgi:hypothetical protein
LDIKYFPFDRQSCTLEFQSWALSKHEIQVVNDTDNFFINISSVDSEWTILNIKVVKKEQNAFVWLEYILLLERNSAFYRMKAGYFLEYC